MTEACIELARLGVPTLVYPMPLAGGTAPVTTAGTVLLHNVELLSALVLLQAARPGTPVIYGTGAARLDMHSGHYLGGGADQGLHLALADMAHFYRLPVNLAGLSTSAEEIDALYGHEATASCLLAYLAGADEVYGMGLLGSAQVLSLEKMVLDNHLARQIEAMLGPVWVDEEHLQAALIEQVGIGGQYLNRRETRDFTRREYIPPWPPAGRRAVELAHSQALELLQSHRPPPLPPGGTERLAAVVAAAERDLATPKEQR